MLGACADFCLDDYGPYVLPETNSNQPKKIIRQNPIFLKDQSMKTVNAISIICIHDKENNQSQQNKNM